MIKVTNLSEKELREIGLQTVHLVREVYRKRRGQSLSNYEKAKAKVCSGPASGNSGKIPAPGPYAPKDCFPSPVSS